ncbi:MAG: tyrosinase family protein [Planctomycetaceae bacterium]|nr:tyrosinase family protein [Planctomycetaceae bacterium]
MTRISDAAQAPPSNPLEDCTPWPPPPSDPIPFTPDTGLAVRTRLSAFELPDDKVGQLRKAYQLLRDLTNNSPNDPRGWLRQANVHCWYCGGEAGTETGAGPEIHGSWRFLPWHRMYLYFHERILAQLVGDKTFALPFWDWDTAGRDRLPPIYADPGTSDDPNPLFDQNRGATADNRIPPGIVTSDAIGLMLSPTSFEAPGGFGGTSDGPGASPGTLENSPHGPVHIWTGDPSMRSPVPDMGVLATAARDPIFFAHHANVDRFWDVWLNQGGRSNPADSSWALEQFAFYDQNDTPQWVAMSIGDSVDHETSLRYIYNGTPNPASTVTFALAMAQTGGTVDVSPQSRETIKVPVPPELSQPRPAEIAVPGPPPKPVYVLHIQGIQVPPDEQTFLRVFLELEDADARTPITSPNFVGQFAILAMRKPGTGAIPHKAAAHSHNQAFELNDRQVAMLRGKQVLSVKLVAVGGRLTKIPYRRAFIAARR